MASVGITSVRTYLRRKRCGDVLDWQIEVLTEMFPQEPKSVSESGRSKNSTEKYSEVERSILFEGSELSAWSKQMDMI